MQSATSLQTNLINFPAKETKAQRRKRLKQERQQQRREQPPAQIKLDQLDYIKPLTSNQEKFFNSYNDGTKHIMLHGVAGTGKTFCALYKALEDVLEPSSDYRKIMIVRSSVQARDMGYLPGNQKEKMDAYAEPYKAICARLFKRNDAWEKLEKQDIIEFASTSFLRGTSFDNTIIIVDETQNLTVEEIDTVMTRVGKCSKIVWCGDFRQTDLNKKSNDKSGLKWFFDVASFMGNFYKVEFEVEDIVRSKIVRDYIIAKLQYEDSL